MSDEREGIFYYLKILYYYAGTVSPTHVQLMDEQAENIESIKRAVRLTPNLTSEERNILSLTYKNAVASRRSSIKNVAVCIRQFADNSESAGRVQRLQEFQARLQDELTSICLDLVRLVDESLAPAAFAPETRVYYEKLKADYYRYICEASKESPDFPQYAEDAKRCYENALEIAQAELPPTSPNYLGLVLNFTVFLYEVMQLQNEAIDLSEKAYADNIDLVDTVDEASYSETVIILRLLRDNFIGWKRYREHQVE
jgi:14-3-3 protein epsilon